jgi:predicted DCC family thiol-disulfide oxidoreductase YuxK
MEFIYQANYKVSVMNRYPLTLFFDSYCPVCSAEMKELEKLDTAGNLRFEDIHVDDFSARFPHIDPVAANKIMHGVYADGTMILGLDVAHQSWRAVGQKRWLGILRLPVVRWFSDLGYLFFARYRYGISYILTGQRRCEPCAKLETESCAIAEKTETQKL